MKPLDKHVLCYNCLGCTRMEINGFRGEYKCEGYRDANINCKDNAVNQNQVKFNAIYQT